jgi:hypothetical protein
MGRGILAVPPKLATSIMTLFVLTNISLSYNVEITVQTTGVHSPERLKRELQLGSVEHNFQRFVVHLWRLLPAYFPLSLPVIDWRNYLRNRGDVKAWNMFGAAGQAEAVKEALSRFH